MQKIIFTFILNIVVLLSYGQLNPIKNLQFNHWYQTPNNCFTLSWSPPDSSLSDTLIGYNIYHDDSLFIFTTDLSHYCNPCIGAPFVPFCNLMMYNMGWFYIHVTAVYNISHIESVYLDSAQFGGIIIGVNENFENKSFNLSPNPFSTQTTLQISENLKYAALTVYNSFGQQVKQLKNISGQTITLHRDNLPSGLYFLRLAEGNNIFTDKIIITDN